MTIPIPATESSASAEQPKRLYRLVEPAYADLSAGEAADFFHSAVLRTRERFGEECRIEASLLARREGPRWNALAGADPDLRSRLEELPPLEREALMSQQVAYSAQPFPVIFWLLGARAEWLAAYRLSAAPDEGQALLLQTARLAIQQRALEASWTGILDRARAIQRSLLPDPLPDLPGFELAARSESADAVGGDVFDAQILAPGALGLMIADASGHGLPAALEARDVVVGLRMGAARQLKIDATIERLNRILCVSTLSSRFISLVYGELDEEGSFDYINAGHPPPLVLSPESARNLPESGRVLGVSPASSYRVGHTEIPPGGLLLLYTDGVTECPSPDGEEFGIERLSGIARVLCEAPAAHLVSAVFDALAEHACQERLPDDASVFVVKRLL
ncbi:MAG: PP2C family protein-serine/threonine phosphatase [Thermoanaerobaculia bacterium]